MFSSTPRPHFTPGKDPVHILQEAGWAPGPVSTGGKSRLHRDSIPERPARSSVAIPTKLPGPQILLIKRYNSCRVLAFSTIFFHSRRSWASSDHLVIFIFLKSFLMSSSHLFLGLPTGQVASGCHLYIFFKILVSGFLCICPNQLIRLDLK